MGVVVNGSDIMILKERNPTPKFIGNNFTIVYCDKKTKINALWLIPEIVWKNNQVVHVTIGEGVTNEIIFYPPPNVVFLRSDGTKIDRREMMINWLNRCIANEVHHLRISLCWLGEHIYDFQLSEQAKNSANWQKKPTALVIAFLDNLGYLPDCILYRIITDKQLVIDTLPILMTYEWFKGKLFDIMPGMVHLNLAEELIFVHQDRRIFEQLGTGRVQRRLKKLAAEVSV